MVDDSGVVFGDDVLAVRLAEFGVPAYFMYDDSAFFAFKDI